MNFDIEVKSKDFVCSLSPNLRYTLFFFPQYLEKIEQLVNEIVICTITTVEGVADSLLKESIPGIALPMRQIDIKSEEKKVMFKTFTFWNFKLKCWHVLMEGSIESFWENNFSTMGNG